MRALFIVMAFLLASLAAGCETVQTTSIADIMRDGEPFINQSVIVLGTFDKVLSGEKNEFGGHYTAYLKDFQDYRIRLVCEDLDKLGKNKRYLVNGTIAYDNKTSDYYLRCTAQPMER